MITIKTLLSLPRLVPLLLLPLVTTAHLPAHVADKPVASLAPMLQQVTPSIVNITVEKVSPPVPNNPLAPTGDNPQQPTNKAIGVGSGVIIDGDKGYIVTNAHVVKDQQIMVVTLKDGRRFRAKLIGKDDGFDLAVIKINANHLTALGFSNSDQLQVGDFVVAIGSPFGLTQTVTSGVVSALNRSEPRIDNYQNFIQTDAPINPGNSGGGLINLQGKLVGINTAIVTPSSGNIGIGFSIPSNLVKSVADQLIRYGKVERGMLGVMAQDITPELAKALHMTRNQGALVTDIIPGSPAAVAALKVQDIIQDVNGSSIRDSDQLHNVLGLLRPGTKIQLTVLRDQKILKLNASIANPTSLKLQQDLPFLNGLRLQKFSDLEPNGNLLSGILVLSVGDTSDGAIAGLLPGDVIVSANGVKTPDIKTLMQIATGNAQQLLLKIARDNVQLFLVIEKS